MSRILVVDDEPAIVWSFREFLTGDGHAVLTAGSAEEALELAAGQAAEVVVLDVRLPGMDGLAAMPGLRERLGDVPIIVMTAFGDLPTAVRAMEEGAFDYLTKPFGLDQAMEVVARALAARAMESTPVQDQVAPAAGRHVMLGSSPRMQAVFKQIALVAGSDVPVLITGESGTGKEVVARAIQKYSRRREAPFVPVSLPALTENLVESELFGHVKGAFTGALENRRGLLEEASGGTVFLDEIGDAGTALQVKLLRAIEQQEITPVGGSQPRSIDTRLIAATNRNLPELIEQGKFREDFYFRLSVFHIHLPPLRDRREDIRQLVEHFLRQTAGSAADPPADSAFWGLLERHAWPGNVRELKNAVEYAAVVSRGNPLRVEHLPDFIRFPGRHTDSGSDWSDQIARWVARQLEGDTPPADLYERFLAVVEPPLLEAVLRQAGNKAIASQLLGIHRATLRQKLRRHHLDAEEG